MLTNICIPTSISRSRFITIAAALFFFLMAGDASANPFRVLVELAEATKAVRSAGMGMEVGKALSAGQGPTSAIRQFGNGLAYSSDRDIQILIEQATRPGIPPSEELSTSANELLLGLDAIVKEDQVRALRRSLQAVPDESGSVGQLSNMVGRLGNEDLGPWRALLRPIHGPKIENAKIDVCKYSAFVSDVCGLKEVVKEVEEAVSSTRPDLAARLAHVELQLRQHSYFIDASMSTIGTAMSAPACANEPDPCVCTEILREALQHQC